MILKPVADAIRFMHSQDLVHRDIKPENFVHVRKGLNSTLKLIDFGMASVSGGGELLETICGSLDYVAPEILRGEKYGQSVDCWSYGVVLYY